MGLKLPKEFVGGSPVTKAILNATGLEDLSVSRMLTKGSEDPPPPDAPVAMPDEESRNAAERMRRAASFRGRASTALTQRRPARTGVVAPIRTVTGS